MGILQEGREGEEGGWGFTTESRRHGGPFDKLRVYASVYDQKLRRDKSLREATHRCPVDNIRPPCLMEMEGEEEESPETSSGLKRPKVEGAEGRWDSPRRHGGGV
jgi:hypothetical protein